MLIALISDTHIPRRARALPPTCVERLQAADLIVHAGDLTTLDALSELRSHGELVAVHGNADDDAVRGALPPDAQLDLAGRRVVVVHDAGPRQGRLARLKRRYPFAVAVIFGHSHTPCHESDGDGFQIFNPGSPTDRRRQPHCTMGLMRARTEGELEFELVTLG